MFKKYSGIYLEHIKNKHVITRWMMGSMATRIGGIMKALENMQQLLYDKYDSIIA